MKIAKILLALVAVLCIVFFFFFSPIFQIKNINVSDSCINGSLEDSAKGKNIFILNPQQITNEIQEQFPCVQGVEIKKKYPRTLDINISSKDSILEIDGTNFSISEDGYVSDKKDGQSLPKIFIPENIKITPNTKVSDERVLFSANLMKQILKSDFNAVNIRILDSSDVAVYNADSTVSLFSQSKDITKQVDSLQSVLAKAKIDATKIAKIDLRFDKPIITLK